MASPHNAPVMVPLDGARLVLTRSLRGRQRLAFAALSLAATALLATGQGWWLVAVLGLSAGLAAWQLRGRRGWPAEAAPLSASREGIFVRRNKVIDGGDITRAMVVSRRGDTEVVLHHRRLFAITVAVRDRAQGEALVRALGRDVDQASMAFPMQPAVSSVAPASIVVPAGLVALLRAFPIAPALRVAVLGALALVPFAWMLLAQLPWRLTVGRDGLLLERFGNRRFIARDEIVSVDLRPPYVRVALRDKRVEAFETSFFTGTFAQGWSRADSASAWLEALADRIARSLALAPEGAAHDDPALFANGRQSRAWREALEALGDQRDAGYRDPSGRRDTLWRIAEDPRTLPEPRAAAAVALKQSLDDEGRARLDALARSSAEPRVRMVIDAVLDDSARGLDDALDRVRDDPELRHLRRGR